MSAADKATVSSQVLKQLKQVDTDSIWWILNELECPDMFMAGLQVLRPDLKMAGRVVTIRFLPMRRDLSDQVKAENSVSVNLRACDRAQPGDVLVTRFQARGGAGSNRRIQKFAP